MLLSKLGWIIVKEKKRISALFSKLRSIRILKLLNSHLFILMRPRIILSISFLFYSVAKSYSCLLGVSDWLWVFEVNKLTNDVLFNDLVIIIVGDEQAFPKLFATIFLFIVLGEFDLQLLELWVFGLEGFRFDRLDHELFLEARLLLFLFFLFSLQFTKLPTVKLLLLPQLILVLLYHLAELSLNLLQLLQDLWFIFILEQFLCVLIGLQGRTTVDIFARPAFKQTVGEKQVERGGRYKWQVLHLLLPFSHNELIVYLLFLALTLLQVILEYKHRVDAQDDAIVMF